MKAVYKILALTLMVAVTPVVLGSKALAQDSEAICPAVYPCDKDGNVIPPFDTVDGPCAEKFRVQCSSEKANLVSEQLVKCEESKKTIEESTRKTIRNLRKQLAKKGK